MDESDLHTLRQPFRDATSGKQAYGAGPSLAIAPSGEGSCTSTST